MIIKILKSCSLSIRLISLCLIVTISACSGGGADVVPLPNTNTGGGGTGVPSYAGPAPSTEDIQRFKLNVWDNLSPENRCGNCHIQAAQAPSFVRTDDIDLAYTAANTIVNLSNPVESIMVQKVLAGHNCWLTSNQACADIIQGYITSWAGGTLGGSSGSVQLVAPIIKDAGASKHYPSSSDDFAVTVYPLVTQYCSGCHSETTASSQSPYFASADVDIAYLAAQVAMDMDTPENSRMVLRLRNQFHNCWDDCPSNSDELEVAITALSNTISLSQLNTNLLPSKALTLFDGILANTGGRHETNVIAKWEFKTGLGNTAFDTSGVNPAMDLDLSGSFDWVGGWGVQIKDGKAQASTSTSKKLHNLIVGSGEYTLEAWVVPANVTQEGPARIISYSGSSMVRNFTLGQTLYNYDFLNRSTTTDVNGNPALSTDDAAERLQAALQHVVVTYSPTVGRRIYINGIFTGDIDNQEAGTLSDWDDSFAFVLGNEVSDDQLWQGILRMVAIHNRVLSDEQISDNFKASVGEKYLLLFSVSDLVNLNDAYIVYEASQYDSYSYLFNQPYFISLDSASAVDGIDIKGIRLGLNGREVIVGQAYKNLDQTITDGSYDVNTGQSISTLGTVIALEKGSATDEFFLTFETIGTNTHMVTEPDPPPPPLPTDQAARSDIGLKTFEKIHATFSSITGVSMAQVDVDNTFQNVKQALPTTEDVNTFVSAQQMAVTQLAISYCNALVNDTALRETFFPGFNFSDDVNNAFIVGDRGLITTVLYDKTMNTNLTSQPTEIEVETELSNLINRLISCNSDNSCALDRTEVVVKATCAAAIGNAGMLLQ